MRRLPPLTAVEAFVQVARLGSIKAAAEDLALSSPALSRRVQTLERFVGKPLFERRHQAMILNGDGELLLTQIAPALDALAVAIDATVGTHELLRLRLSVPALFASQRILPKLPQLRAAEPDFHVDIDTQPYAVARLGEGIDAAIVLAREIDPSLYSRKLIEGRLAAIGPKSLLEGPKALRSPADIASHTILIHRDLPESFVHWREAVGMPELEPAATDHFDSGPLMLEAAAAGLGIAFLFEEHAELSHDARLVTLFENEIDSSYGYWFVARRAAMSNRAVRIFHDWLLKSMF